MPAPFPFDPHLTGIAVLYQNASYIADIILPRVLVGSEKFKYQEFALAEQFNVPDTKVGRKGQPNEVEFTGTEVADITNDYGLDDPIPQADIDNAPPNYSPVDRAIQRMTDYILLAREIRASGLVFNNANYNADNKTVLAGTAQWSDFANSDPVDDILAGIEAMLVPATHLVLGSAVWTKLRQHPKIMKGVNGTAGDEGVASRQQVSDLLELPGGIVVGASRLNSAKKGQAPVLARAWGKHAALVNVNPNADTQGDLTFGFTAQWGERVGGQETDSKIGLRGGQRVRVGESVKELIIADRAGYFLEDAIG